MNKSTKIILLITAIITCTYCFANLFTRTFAFEYKLTQHTSNKIEIVEVNDHDYIVINAMVDDVCRGVSIIHDVNCTKCNNRQRILAQ